MAGPNGPLLWYDTIDVVLLGTGFTSASLDPCVYSHGTDHTFSILMLYVDETLIGGGSNFGAVNRLKKALKDLVAMTDMGEVSINLGTNCTRNYGEGTLTNNQK